MGNPGISSLASAGRQRHSREELIERIKTYLAHPQEALFRVCRQGLEDALHELEKPVLPDNALALIRWTLSANPQNKRFEDVAYMIFEALLPKPETKTVWVVGRAPDEARFDTEGDAFEALRRRLERGEAGSICKQEVPA